MALKLDILANTRQFVGEMKQAGASVENISDELDDMAREGKQAGDKLERSFRDSVREAKKLDDKLDDVGKGFGKGFDKGAKDVKRNLDDVEREAESTAKETAASFDGSAESIGDAFQEVAANAFAGFGPAGAAAGIAAAIGLGAITAAITANQEAAEAFKENLSDMYQEAAEEGRTFLSDAQIQAEAARILFEQRDTLKAEAAAIGVDVVTLARAYAGAEQEANLAIEAANGSLERRLDTLNLEGTAQAGKVTAVDDESRAIQEVSDKLKDQLTWHEQNKEAAEDVTESQRRGEEQKRQEIQKTHDAGMRLFDMFNERAKAPYTALIQVAADTSKYDAAVRKLQQQSLTKTVIVRPGGPVLYN